MLKLRFILLGGAALIVAIAASWKFLPMPPASRPVKATAAVGDAATTRQFPTRPRPAMVPETNSVRTIEDLQRRLEEQSHKLTPERAEAFLRENHRNGASLLAASRVFGDKAYLREAMEKFPNDPRVAFDAYFFSGPRDATNPAPPELRGWLDRFMQSDPNNALPFYLAARDDFKAGQTADAVLELQAAGAKGKFSSYLMDALQSTEEAYRSAGYSEVDAKLAAGSGLLLPHLVETKRLGENITDLAVQYQKAGDTASAQNILQVGLTLSQQVGGPGEFPLINTLVGIAIQKQMLSVMDPASPYLDTGNTVQEQLNALNQYRQSFKPIAAQEAAIIPQMSDADLINYYDRRIMFGHAAAMKWAVEKYGGQ